MDKERKPNQRVIEQNKSSSLSSRYLLRNALYLLIVVPIGGSKQTSCSFDISANRRSTSGDNSQTDLYGSMYSRGK